MNVHEDVLQHDQLIDFLAQMVRLSINYAFRKVHQKRLPGYDTMVRAKLDKDYGIGFP